MDIHVCIHTCAPTEMVKELTSQWSEPRMGTGRNFSKALHRCQRANAAEGLAVNKDIEMARPGCVCVYVQGKGALPWTSVA